MGLFDQTLQFKTKKPEIESKVGKEILEANAGKTIPVQLSFSLEPEHNLNAKKDTFYACHVQALNSRGKYSTIADLPKKEGDSLYGVKVLESTYKDGILTLKIKKKLL